MMCCALTLNHSSENCDWVKNEISLCLFTQENRTIFVPHELQMLHSFELIAPGEPSRHTMQASRTMKKRPKPWPSLSIKHPGKKDVMEDLSKCASTWRVLCAWTVQWAVVSGEWFQMQQSQSSLKMNQITMLSWGLPVFCGTFLCSSTECSSFSGSLSISHDFFLVTSNICFYIGPETLIFFYILWIQIPISFISFFSHFDNVFNFYITSWRSHLDSWKNHLGKGTNPLGWWRNRRVRCKNQLDESITYMEE